MKKKTNKKGFTLAELLIVVAIIAVLVLVAIPVFTASLNKAKKATDEANCRSYYAELQSSYLTDGKVDAKKVTSQSQNKIEFANGDDYELQYGTYTVNASDDTGYEVSYTATGDSSVTASWGGSGTTDTTGTTE